MNGLELCVLAIGYYAIVELAVSYIAYGRI